MVRLIHQTGPADMQGKREWWLLDGVGYRKGRSLELHKSGYTWLPGYKCPGTWEVQPAEAQVLIDRGIPVYEVGDRAGVELEQGE